MFPSSFDRRFADLVDGAMELTVAPSWSKIGPAVRRRLDHWGSPPPPRLDGRVVVVTGVTSGIGRAAVDDLADLGAELHLVGRDAERVRTVAAELRAGGGRATTSTADLSDLDDVHRLAEEITADHDQVDVVIHNAGALTRTRTTSAQGFETTVAAQVLGPFLLTTLLLPALRAAGPGARVLTMSSGGMYTERLDVDRLEMGPEDYDGVKAYARAKRAQVELNVEWARRHAGPIAFHALHPGWVDTPGVVAGLPGFHRVAGPMLRDAAEGADTAVWLAAAPPEQLGPSGGFWLDRRRRRIDKVPWTRAPAGERERLWRWCEQRAGLDPA